MAHVPELRYPRAGKAESVAVPQVKYVGFHPRSPITGREEIRRPWVRQTVPHPVWTEDDGGSWKASQSCVGWPHGRGGPRASTARIGSVPGDGTGRAVAEDRRIHPCPCDTSAAGERPLVWPQPPQLRLRLLAADDRPYPQRADVARFDVLLASIGEGATIHSVFLYKFNCTRRRLPQLEGDGSEAKRKPEPVA